MSCFVRFCFSAISIVLSFQLQATTWADTEVDDPIATGSKCSVYEPMSWGGYIYSWPEKYDQVFWPTTVENGIWFCNRSGYAAFVGDFKNLSDSERKNIEAFLSSEYKGDNTIKTKLVLLEKIYELRNKDDNFKNYLLRVLARWYQNIGEQDTANHYREKALQGIEYSLKGELPEQLRLEYYYIAANYSRQLSNISASKYYEKQLMAGIENLKDYKLKGFTKYLKKLIEDTSKIKPGGKLDPVPETK